MQSTVAPKMWTLDFICGYILAFHVCTTKKGCIYID